MKKLFLALVFFSACSLKNDYKSSSVFVVFKSENINLAEQGFLKTSSKGLNLELYKLAKAFFELKINQKICINQACYDKIFFNQKFLNKSYYDDILLDILKKRPIFSSKNLVSTTCGFKQDIKAKNYNIFYEVCANKISFVDKISNIKISLTFE